MKGFEPSRWLQGWLVAEIRGPGDAFLAAAWQEGLELRQTRAVSGGLQAEVSLGQVGALRRAARASRCRVRLLARRGWPFVLAGLRRRLVLPLLAVAFGAALCFACSLVGTVEQESVGGEALSREETARVLSLSQEAGLRRGVSLWYIDLREVESYIQSGFPQLYYVKVERQGRRLVVETARRSDEPEGLARPEQGDMLATCDGVIEEILVLRGTAAVAVGETVQAGEVLVYGRQGEEAVAAAALVRARVWTQARGECALRRELISESGESRLRVSLRLGAGGWLRIFGPEQAPWPLCWRQSQRYQLSPWRNQALSVEIVVSKLCRLQSTPLTYTPEQALELAAEEAFWAAKGQLLREQSWAALTLRDAWLLSSQVEEGQAQVELVVEGVAHIGQVRGNSEK